MGTGAEEASAVTGGGPHDLQRRYEAERKARIEAEARLGAAQVALASLEGRLGEVEDELEECERDLADARRAVEQAGKAKTTFLANMSHEIRTPISAVMGYANLIAATEEATAETREWSQRLQRSAEHLLALLDDVLDLAKIDAGRLDLHLVPTEPATVLEEVGVLMEPRALDRGLELIVASDTELPARIRTDPLRLRQVLINLVGNALKYTERGQVALHARVQERPDEGGGQRLILAVSDTGIGIPESELERLFQPFEQGARPRGGGAGVGLGLDIARRLARMLGGDITVTSRVGVGSTFTLSLPVDPELGPATTPARLVTRGGTLRPEGAGRVRLDGRLILLVDDTEDNRRIVAHFLTHSGARVIEVETLAQAIAALAREPRIALVLTDLQLPDGDGLELVQRLRREGSQQPVVALTADAMIETRMRALTSGVDDFIVKPIVGTRLVARLAAIFARADARLRSDPAMAAAAGIRGTRPLTPRPSLLVRPATTSEIRKRPAAATIQRRIGSEPFASQGGREGSAEAGLTPAAQATDRPTKDRGWITNKASLYSPRPDVPASRPDVPIELLQKFYAVLAERVYALEDAIRLEDRTRLREAAHRVAGSGGAMGHPELTDLGRELEQAAAGPSPWDEIEPLALRFLTAARHVATRRPWA